MGIGLQVSPQHSTKAVPDPLKSRVGFDAFVLTGISFESFLSVGVAKVCNLDDVFGTDPGGWGVTSFS